MSDRDVVDGRTLVLPEEGTFEPTGPFSQAKGFNQLIQADNRPRFDPQNPEHAALISKGLAMPYESFTGFTWTGTTTFIKANDGGRVVVEFKNMLYNTYLTERFRCLASFSGRVTAFNPVHSDHARSLLPVFSITPCANNIPVADRNGNADGNAIKSFYTGGCPNKVSLFAIGIEVTSQHPTPIDTFNCINTLHWYAEDVYFQYC